MPMEIQLSTLDHAKNELVSLAIHFGPKLLVAVLILVAGVMVSGWVARGTARSLQRLELEPPVRQLLTRVVRAVVFTTFAILALQNMGVELLPLIAGLSIIGAGVALATQGVLGNAVAGLTIIFTKPYRVGEYVAIVGVEGQVESVTLFSTTLIHSDRSRIVVPNRKVVGELLHNYGRIRQSALQVGVAYGTDLAVALRTVEELVTANSRVLADPAPSVSIALLGDSAIQIAIKPWVGVADFGTVEGELNLAIVEAFRQRGIIIPFPHREVRLIGASH
jgi:small conductance mechanosensitive channel